MRLAARTPASLEVVAEEVRAAGGRASVAVVEALDEDAVEAHALQVGDIDIAFNAIGVNVVAGRHGRRGHPGAEPRGRAAGRGRPRRGA